MLYFAYGSNMNSKRMLDRGVKFLKKEIGFLYDYKFIINKKSYKNPNIGYANIIKKKNSIVEGILYTINEYDIKKLDKYEGYPKHYDKKILDIISNNNIVKSITYIANKNWITNKQLKTTKDYKNHILEGKDILSKEYLKKLNESIKII